MTAFRVLFVCIGNVCRSPLGHLALAARLPGDDYEISSAGVAALEGSAMSPEAAAHLEVFGTSAEGFVARQLTPAMIEEADLVLTATRQIRAQVLEEYPRAMRRTFTVLEFAALLDGVDVHQRSGAVDPSAVVAAAVEGRGRAQVAEYDIPDPFRRGAPAHAEAATAMSGAVETIARALKPRPARRRIPPTPPPAAPAKLRVVR